MRRARRQALLGQALVRALSTLRVLQGARSWWEEMRDGGCGGRGARAAFTMDAPFLVGTSIDLFLILARLARSAIALSEAEPRRVSSDTRN